MICLETLTLVYLILSLVSLHKDASVLDPFLFIYLYICDFDSLFHMFVVYLPFKCLN